MQEADLPFTLAKAMAVPWANVEHSHKIAKFRRRNLRFGNNPGIWTASL